MTPIRIHKWAIFFVDKNEGLARSFFKAMQKNAEKMGIEMANPLVSRFSN